MAEFEGAVENTLLWEGGYVNNPLDSGGETYRGISRKNFPEWGGWPYIDFARMLLGFPKTLDSNPSLQGEVIVFYRANFWKYGGVSDQQVANKIFDLAVNVGPSHAHKIVQHAVGIEEDGVWGPETERSVNAFPSNNGSLVTLIRIGAADYHTAIVHDHPKDAAFLAGWLRRDRA